MHFAAGELLVDGVRELNAASQLFERSEMHLSFGSLGRSRIHSLQISAQSEPVCISVLVFLQRNSSNFRLVIDDTLFNLMIVVPRA